MDARIFSHLFLLAILVNPTTVHAEQDPKILIMAHRGGKGLWPENTLYGYQKALESGVDVLEIDIWRTKDGVVIVNHDETVDRTTNGRARLEPSPSPNFNSWTPAIGGPLMELIPTVAPGTPSLHWTRF